MAHTRSHRGLLLIGLFKVLKSATLIAIGIGALHMLHKDVAAEIAKWADALDLDPNNPWLMRVLEKVSDLDPRKLAALSVGTFSYAALFLTEGTGLLLRKRWAEYLTIISTAGLIPLEIYEIAKRVNFVRIGVLVVNIAIVIFLVVDLRRERERAPASEAPQRAY